MEDFITTEYNFELQKLEKQIDQQKKSTSVFGEGESMLPPERRRQVERSKTGNN